MPLVVTSLVTPTVAQAWMGDSLDMNSFDQDFFNQAVSDASQAVIDYLDWDPTSQQKTELYSGLGGSVIIVNREPVTAVQSVSIARGYGYLGSPPPNPLLVDTTTLVLDGREIIWPCGCFPVGRKNITVTYTAGYTTIPGTIQRATLYTLKAMWTAPGSDQNATGESFPGVLSQSWWPTGAGAVPPSATALLDRGYPKKIHAG